MQKKEQSLAFGWQWTIIKSIYLMDDDGCSYN